MDFRVVDYFFEAIRERLQTLSMNIFISNMIYKLRTIYDLLSKDLKNFWINL